MNRQHLSYSSVTIALLFVCLIAINLIAYFLPLRWDVTEDQLYTISEGTKKIVAGMEDPMTLKFYFSKSNEELPTHFKSYAQRIEELLGEYVALSKGKITLEVYDPKPDTDEEEWAKKYGIHEVPLPSGSAVYFGMVSIVLDREESVAFFDPRREEFLEYDISRVLMKVSSSKTTKIGILSGLDVMGTSNYPPDPETPSTKWSFISELEKNFSVENLPITSEEIPDDITLLLVLHPKNFDQRLEYAIDQYVLRGGHLVVLVDPNSRVDMQMSAAMSQYGRQPEVSSDLKKLFQVWGIEYDKAKLIGDLKNATSVNAGSGGVVRYPLWITLSSEDLNQEHPLTTQLENIFMPEAGSLSKAAGSEVEFTPIVSSSTDSGLLDTFVIRFTPPDQIAKQIKADQTPKTIAAIVRGTFKSAFPGGQPPKPPKEGEDSQKNEEPAPLKHEHLNQAKAKNTVLVITDVDFISDSFSVQKMNFLGQVLISPMNDNLNLMQNAVEYLSGDDALMSIRSRGRFSRPFTRLIALQQHAQTRYQEEETLLQKKLEDVRKKLESLQKQTGNQRKVILTPELQREIEQFRAEERNTKKRLREVRKILRQDIEQLGTTLLTINMLAIPLIIAVVGIVFFVKRNRKRKEAKKK
ncbi:Gldg family protein [Deltaproteobacteria bacterium TL4]